MLASSIVLDESDLVFPGIRGLWCKYSELKGHFMSIKRGIFLFFLVLSLFFPCLFLSVSWATAVKNDKAAATATVQDDNAASETGVIDNTLPTLKSILELRAHLEKQLREKKKLLKHASSQSEKEQLQRDIQRINQQLTESREDFDRIAAGIDISSFQDKKEKKFDWKEEITSLVRPALDEMKRMTAKVRQKSELNMEIERVSKLLPSAKDAVKNIKKLISETKDRTLKRALQKELKKWNNTVTQLENEYKIAKMQLEQLESEEKSLLEASRSSVAHFFKTRGLYLILSVLVFVGIIIFWVAVYRLIVKVVPGYREEHISLKLRIFDLTVRIIAAVMAIGGIFVVLYLAQDWMLLSLAIVVMLGAAWTARLAIPRMWNQGRLMLNIGPVREGERVVIDGIPWLVKKINVYSDFYNPELGVTLRFSIDKLLTMESRPFDRSERWFPCRKGDWVILSDGTRGKVISQTHEMVDLVMRGGARKSYRTADFLSLNPLNLSSNFRIKVPFGISYDLQEHATSLIPQALSEYIEEKVQEEGYAEHLKNLRVEFKEAGASSLDLVVIADFDGEMAPLYNRLKRAVQRWCVEACTINNWDIPFPQLTVHKA